MRIVHLWVASLALAMGGGCGATAQGGPSPAAAATATPDGAGAAATASSPEGQPKPSPAAGEPTASASAASESAASESAASESSASRTPAHDTRSVEPPCAPPLLPTECPYVGRYRQGSVDAVAELVLLNDHTFCYGYMGGAVDMLVPGRWEQEPSAGGIHLREVRPDRAWFAVRAREDGLAGQEGKVVVAFRGQTLSNARRPAIALSSSATPPATLRPLFGGGSEAWGLYELPAVERRKARYLYVGGAEARSSADPSRRLFVTQFELGPGKYFTVAYDQRQASALMDKTATLEDGVLSLDRHTMGKRFPLTETEAAGVRHWCIERGFEGKPPGEEPLRYRGEDEIWTRLVPVQTFYLGLEAVQGKPWFRNDAKRPSR